MSFTIKDKIALVTGANRGIGKSIVESFLSHGATKVFLGVRDLDSAANLVKEYGDRVEAIVIDVEDSASIQSAADKAKDVNVVVNNAGVLKTSKILDNDAEEALHKELSVNLFGLVKMAKAFSPVLENNSKSGGSAFVQLNSIASMKAFADVGTYSISKAASYSATQSLKDLFAEKGIQVLSVHPGPIATDMADQAGFTDVAESTTVVSEGIVNALEAGEFHLFPDTMAKEIEGAYKSFAENVVEASMEEA